MNEIVIVYNLYAKIRRSSLLMIAAIPPLTDASVMTQTQSQSLQIAANQIKTWGAELGFNDVRITDTDLELDAARLKAWLGKSMHMPLEWMTDHGDMRYTPSSLLAGTQRVISVRLNYLPADVDLVAPLKQENTAYISRYALGRDYHKLVRKRLAKLAAKIATAYPGSAQRALVDSAPAMEKALARKAGHGWVGKNSLIIHPEDGSYFFLGEIYTDLELPIDQPNDHDRCDDCEACLKVCPTDAFVAPYQLEVKRCISYLTIENSGPIPLEFREAIGNRVFGCDDCQIICPWNKEAATTEEEDFSPRNDLDSADLSRLFRWTEEEFLATTIGSPLRRTGYHNFLRNLAVGLGNAPSSDEHVTLLKQRLDENLSEMLNEHIRWAIERQESQRKRRRKSRRS